MSPYSKKRAADDSDEDKKVSVKTSKKTKHGISADGEDDEGNPFWEVCELCIYVILIGQISPRTNMCLAAALKQAPCWSVAIQKHVSGQRPGVLRERRQNASWKEGAHIDSIQDVSSHGF